MSKEKGEELFLALHSLLDPITGLNPEMGKTG
jgi:hypothetical protein